MPRLTSVLPQLKGETVQFRGEEYVLVDVARLHANRPTILLVPCREYTLPIEQMHPIALHAEHLDVVFTLVPR